MDTNLIAATVIVLIVVFDKALQMLKSRGIDLQKVSRQIENLHGWHDDFPILIQQINDLYKWHDVSDSDGTKIWYIKGSLEKAIERLAINIDNQTKAYGKIDRRLESIELKMGLYKDNR